MATTSGDITRAVEIIDQRIQTLQRIKEMLLSEFGSEPAGMLSTPSHIPLIITSTKKTRKEMLTEFLKHNGPLLRAEILQKTGMPKGTIAFLLNDKETFQRHSDGRWTVR
ncbi:MAG TPA: hypothetical protein VGL70_19960 [Candidatus Binatia bacterium]|jgi:hypothetical protein